MDYSSLFSKSDFSAVVFQKFLLPTGQVSTDAIFSSDSFKSDIAYIKDKIFVFMLKPFLEICDCVVRVDDFSSLHINFVLILKEEVISRIKEEYTMQENKHISIAGLNADMLRNYRNEIHESNVKKCMQFLRSGYILTSNEDFSADMANKAKSIMPFSVFKITLDLFNIARIMCPSWVSYMGSVVEEAKLAIKEDNRKANHLHECVLKTIIDGQLYWDAEANTFPRYPDFISWIVMNVKEHGDISTDRETVQKMLEGLGTIFAFRSDKEESDSELRVTLDTQHFTLRRMGLNVSITENGDPIQILSAKKTNFLHKHIKTLVLSKRRVITDPSFVNDYDNRDIKIIYMDKVNEIFAKAIYSKRYKNLCTIMELFKFQDFHEQQILFGPAAHSMMTSIEEFIVHKAVLNFIRDLQNKQSWLSKLINSFISQWSEKHLSDSIADNENKMGYISNNILKMGQAKTKNTGGTPSGKKPQEYSPVQSVINIIKEDLKASDIRKIIAKGGSPDLQSSRILSLYDDIGATSKAVINKNERLQSEFLSKVRGLVLKK